MSIDRSAVGRKSSRKGKVRERMVAESLSIWWTSGKDRQAFRRTPQSGGFPKKRSHGDIVAVSPEARLFPFLIEVKDRKEAEDVDFADMLTNEKHPVVRWWSELSDVVADVPLLHAGKHKLLIVHKRQKDYCLVDVGTFQHVVDNAGPLPNIKIRPVSGEVLIVFPFKALLEKDPETLKSFSEQLEVPTNGRREQGTRPVAEGVFQAERVPHEPDVQDSGDKGGGGRHLG